jgi:hypothetical protein
MFIRSSIRNRALQRISILALGGACAFAGDVLVDAIASDSFVSQTASAQQEGDREGGEGRQRGRRGQDGQEGRGGRGGEGGQEGRQEGRGGRGGGMMGGFGGMQDVRELLEPEFSRRDVPLFVEQLQLDDSQRPIVEALIFDYEDAFQEGSEVASEGMRSLGREMMQAFMGGGGGGGDAGGGGGGGMREAMRESMREIRDEMEGLDLSDEERRGMFRERMQEVAQEQLSIAQEGGVLDSARGVMGQMLDILQEWTGVRTRLHDQTVSDVKAQLSDDQLVLFPAFERFIVREKTLPNGRLSGENANLFLLLDDAGLSDDAFSAVEEHFDDYEIALHQALIARNRYIVSSATDLYRAMRDGNADQARNVLERQVRYREAVRNVNDNYRTVFVNSIVDEGERATVDAAILAEAYERIYRPSGTQRAFEAAKNLETLSDDQLVAIAELEGAFLIERGNRNTQLVSLTRKSDAEEQVSRGERMVAMLAGDLSRGMPWGGSRGGEDDPMRSAMERRRELDESYRERLNALLTPEQQEELPQVRQGRGGGGWGGRGGGGDSERQREFMERFDTDGDGELSGEEREKMIEEFRGGGRGGRGGRGGEGGEGGEGGQGGRGERGNRRDQDV